MIKSNKIGYSKQFMTQENYILRSAKATPAHVSAYATSVLAVVDSLHISRKKIYQQPSVNKESM